MAFLKRAESGDDFAPRGPASHEAGYARQVARLVRAGTKTLALAAFAVGLHAAEPEKFPFASQPRGAVTALSYLAQLPVPMAPKKPAGLTREPVYKNPPLYVALSFGDTGRPTLVALDENDDTATLYADANGNGDLTDDPPAKLLRRVVGDPEKTKFAKVRIHVYFEAPIAMAYRDGHRETVNVCFMIYGRSERRRSSVEPTLVYWRDYYRTGAITLDGKAYQAALLDNNCDGLYDSPPSTMPNHWFKGDLLFIDADASGKFDRPLEMFNVRQPFNLGGVTYEVASLAPDGSAISFKRSAQQVAPRVAAKALAVGETPPDFETPGLGKLSALRGKVVLVDFWATWCIPCRYESPNVRKVYDQYKSAGFEVISVSIDKPEDAAKIPAVMKEDGMTWPQVHDLTRKIQQAYYVTAVPAMFLIDQEGRIASTNARGEELGREVARLLRR
jgi:peroxiredoxin